MSCLTSDALDFGAFQIDLVCSVPVNVGKDLVWYDTIFCSDVEYISKPELHNYNLILLHTILSCVCLHLLLSVI